MSGLPPLAVRTLRFRVHSGVKSLSLSNCCWKLFWAILEKQTEQPREKRNAAVGSASPEAQTKIEGLFPRMLRVMSDPRRTGFEA